MMGRAASAVAYATPMEERLILSSPPRSDSARTCNRAAAADGCADARNASTGARERMVFIITSVLMHLFCSVVDASAATHTLRPRVHGRETGLATEWAALMPSTRAACVRRHVCGRPCPRVVLPAPRPFDEIDHNSATKRQLLFVPSPPLSPPRSLFLGGEILW